MCVVWMHRCVTFYNSGMFSIVSKPATYSVLLFFVFKKLTVACIRNYFAVCNTNVFRNVQAKCYSLDECLHPESFSDNFFLSSS